MSAVLAVGLAMAALVLMVAIIVGIAVIVAIDTAAAWPAKPRHRRSFGQQMWVRSVEVNTVAIAVPQGRWSR